MIQLQQGRSDARRGDGPCSRVRRYSSTVTLTPSVPAEMLTRPKTARLLMLSLKTDPRTRAAMSLVTRIGVKAREIEQEHAVQDFLDAVPAAGRGSLTPFVQ